MKFASISTFILVSFVVSIGVAKPLFDSADNGNDQDITDVLKANGEFFPSQIRAGDQAQIRINLDLAPHHHAYLERFKLKPAQPSQLKVGPLTISPLVKFFDAVTKTMKDGIKGQATLTATIELNELLPVGKTHADFNLTYQACTEAYCLLPKTIPVRVDFTVIPGAGSSNQVSAPAPETAGGFQNALAHGILYTFLFVFLIGILTSLTPCIYPMIPITLAIIGSREKGASKWQGFSLSVTYVLGIAVTYAALGVVAAKTGALFGSFMSSPWVAGGIAALFVLLALSMYGLFELQVPAFIRNKLGSKKTGTGYTGAFVTGLLAGVVASPCVGPVLVGVLAYIAKTQSSLLGFLLLFTFAMGIGVLLIAVGTFGHLLNHMPKSGKWMEGVKFFFGTIMVAAALYYLQPIVSTWIFDGFMAISLILISSCYGAFETGPLTATRLIRKGLFLTAFWFGLLYAAMAMNHWIHIFPTMTSTTAESKAALNWQPYSDSAFASAQKSGHAMILDFSAAWCGACHELEENTFTDPAVINFVKQNNITLLKVDATDTTPEVNRLSQKFKVMGLPTLHFYGPSGHLANDLTLTGYEAPDAFLKRITQMLSR